MSATLHAQSGDLAWLLLRTNSSFLVKRNGLQLSREVNNLRNKHSLRLAGSNPKPVAIEAAEKGVKVTIATAKGLRSTTLKGNVRQSTKALTKIISQYRPDLIKDSLARVSRIISSQGPGKIVKAKKVRGAAK